MIKQEKISNKIIKSEENFRYLQCIQSLELDLCPCKWGKYLSQRDWKKINRLSLTFCQISPSNLKNLFKYDWNNLKTLLLGFNRIGSSGLKLLIKVDLPSLQQMWLRRCMIGNEGAKHITKANWPSLKRLSLRNNCIQLDGYISIAQNLWKKLQMLQMEQYKQDIYQFNNYITVAYLIATQPNNNRVSKVFSKITYIYAITRLQKGRGVFIKNEFARTYVPT